MKRVIVLVSSLAVVAGYLGCSAQLEDGVLSSILTKETSPTDSTVSTRFIAPEGFERKTLTTTSFGFYLRNLPLHKPDYEVHFYDGRIKHNNNVYCAVVNQEIDPVDLQQCADAVMRLRGEYLFQLKAFDQIKFNFLSDGKPRYFKDHSKGNYSYQAFRKYMKYIFSYANTASLKNELRPIGDIRTIEIGDVFIQSGNPYGHAIIVVDLVENALGDKKMLLAQSYMPAQETQILINQLNNSPWFDVKEGVLETPEWTFYSTDLRRF